MSKRKEDLKLIEACLQNDRKAQKQLYEEHKTAWFLCCLRYAEDRMEAEDILQNAVISIFTSLKSFDPDKGTFSTWSNRVVINAALQFLRKWRPVDYRTVSEAEALDYPDKSETIYDRLNAQELVRMVQQLPLGYRMVFNLYVIEGFKHHEIAEQLKITIGTSKSQLFKAKKMLKKRLELLFQNQ